MRKRIFLVIPTAGTRMPTLREIINQAGIPHSQIIIMRTAAAPMFDFNCQIIDAFGELNIHRWWNHGMRAALAQGATHVAVANDDVSLDQQTLELLSDSLDRTGATMATPGESLECFQTMPLWRRVLNGAFWMQKAPEILLADEDSRWAYGDDDLDIRARTQGTGVVTVPVTFQHIHLQEATDASPELLNLSLSDASTFRRKYPVRARIYSAYTTYTSVRLKHLSTPDTH